MERRPSQALTTTYVHPTSPGKFQARVRDASTGRDVKVTSGTVEEAVKTARKRTVHT
jgi:hypothetical protein